VASQSVAPRHSTHAPLVGSHTLAVPKFAQSPESPQPLHWPVSIVHTGALAMQPLVAHSGTTQWWSMHA
jgi:hypothetical protein